VIDLKVQQILIERNNWNRFNINRVEFNFDLKNQKRKIRNLKGTILKEQKKKRCKEKNKKQRQRNKRYKT
jgi:hypothetical protein